MKHIEDRTGFERMHYLVTNSFIQWDNCELVTRVVSDHEYLTPSEAQCVSVVDRAIWNMIFNIGGNG